MRCLETFKPRLNELFRYAGKIYKAIPRQEKPCESCAFYYDGCSKTACSSNHLCIEYVRDADEDDYCSDKHIIVIENEPTYLYDSDACDEISVKEKV
jgi:hypothetical protein